MYGSGSLFGSTTGASQTFSMGFGATQGPGVAEGAGKKGKQEDKQICLPVTIGGILNAIAQSSADGELKFFGVEPSMLVLVAAAEVVHKTASSIELVLNDATGRIKARHYLTESQPGALDDIIAGRYVTVFGSVRTAPELHVAAMGVRLAQSADDVSYHMIESGHAALKLQKGVAISSIASPKKMAGLSMDLSPPKEAEPLSSTPAMPAAPAAAAAAPKARLEGASLRAAIVAFIKREEAGREEGVSFEAIAGYAEPAPAAEVRSVLEELVNEGEAITTVDDNHFSCQI